MDFVRVSIVLRVASQLSNLWRNNSRSPGKQKTFIRDFRVFLFTPKMRLSQYEADVTPCVGIEILVRKHCIAFIRNNKHE